MRDPSAILIALVLPLILLFIFGYGVNLDSSKIRIGLVLEGQSPDIASLTTAFTNSRFLDVAIATDRREFQDDLTAGRLRGMVVIPSEFSVNVAQDDRRTAVQVIADGSEPNIASFVQNYVRGVVSIWLLHRIEDNGRAPVPGAIQVEPHFWYNPELRSRDFLLPGSIAIIMTLIGSLLTALVIAREWERGTMESMMATPVSIAQILLGKLIPYFVLGMCAMFLCVGVATLYYGVPFRGSLLLLTLFSSVFLLAALGQGLLISSLAKDQFLAAQIALMSAFLPAFMLSGFIFEISAMPEPIQLLTYAFAARYYVSGLQTLFLTGNIWTLIFSSMAAMAAIALFFFVVMSRKTRKRLDA